MLWGSLRSRELTYLISQLWKRKIILKIAISRGYVSSQKGIEIAHEMGIVFLTN